MFRTVNPGSPDARPLPANPLETIDEWPVASVSAASVRRTGMNFDVETRGASSRRFPLASVTKPLIAYATLIAVEEGSLDLDEPQPVGGREANDGWLVTLRQLLAHASGMGPDSPDRVAEPETRRIYSNAGFEEIGRRLESATGLTMATYFNEAVVQPLQMAGTELLGSPAHAAVSSVDDLVLFIRELLSPALLAPETIAEATRPQFADLAGVLPGYGRRDPNPWGLGFEIRGDKHPHWTSPRNSRATFGHFGRSGTMLWIDPACQVGCVALSDRDFGSWAAEAWPALGTAVLDQLSPIDSP